MCLLVYGYGYAYTLYLDWYLKSTLIIFCSFGQSIKPFGLSWCILFTTFWHFIGEQILFRQKLMPFWECCGGIKHVNSSESNSYPNMCGYKLKQTFTSFSTLARFIKPYWSFPKHWNNTQSGVFCFNRPFSVVLFLISSYSLRRNNTPLCVQSVQANRKSV